MDTKTYLINQDKRLEPSSLDAVLHRQQERKLHYWIDVQNPDATGLAELLSPLEPHPLVMERCLDRTTYSGVSPYENIVLIQLPERTAWDDLGRSLLSILCLPRLIITLHTRIVPALKNLEGNFTAMIGHHDVSTSVILYLMLDHLTDEATAFALQARQAIDTLDNAINEGVETDQIGQRILTLKRIVAHSEITMEEQHHCLTALLSIETDPLSIQGLHEYFHDAVSHLEHSLRYVERMETRLSELHQHFLLILQNKTNDRLKMITILSAVFMPLTLVAGIYGMNFYYMPELKWHYSYPLVLLVMIALAAGLMAFFYHKGWFK